MPNEINKPFNHTPDAEAQKLIDAVRRFEQKKEFANTTAFAKSAVQTIETRRPLKRSLFSSGLS